MLQQQTKMEQKSKTVNLNLSVESDRKCSMKEIIKTIINLCVCGAAKRKIRINHLIK